MIEPKSVLTGKKFSGEPVVSVCVITYNHGKYIRQCLDGILMQEVTFPYEILIHDDASPDNTAEIIREYEAKYPEIIKPIYQTVNQYSQGIDVGKYNFERAVGKYIALCEGDDYWTDPKKLQMQVDFLEKHPEYVATAHNVRTINEFGQLVDENKHPYPILDEHQFTIKDAEDFHLPGQTASIVFRNIFKDINDEIKQNYYLCKTNGDQKLSLLITLNGNIWCFKQIMADHRKIVTSGDSWSARTHDKNLSLETYLQAKNRAEFVKKSFDYTTNIDNIYIACHSSSLKQVLSRPNKENLAIFMKFNRIYIDSHGNRTRLFTKTLRKIKNYIIKEID